MRSGWLCSPARLAHAYALAQEGDIRLRVAGMAGTITVIVAAAVSLLATALVGH